MASTFIVAAFWNKVIARGEVVVATARGPSPLEIEVTSLFEQLRLPVLRYLFSLRIPAPDAEEIVQEVFLLLFRYLRQGKSREHLHGWVFKTAHNMALKHRTRARRTQEHFCVLPPWTEGPDDSAPGPEERLEAIEKRRRLLAVVRALPEMDQCCLSLRAEGLRYREIAAVLSISLGSVANSLEKSLARLACVAG